MFKQQFLLLFAIALVYRIYACFQAPVVSSDILRHLGYSSHALEHNFTIYTTKASDFLPEIWAAFWSHQTYIYPPVTLIFFHFFSSFHLGIFWVKITLTLIDLGCAYLFYKHVSQLAAVLFFCSPVSLWYTSHEGQFEILQTLFIIFNTLAVQKKQWRFAGFWFAISIQVKQFGVLIAPWMLYKIWTNQDRDSHKSFFTILSKVFQGMSLGFLPFLGFYIQTPNLLLLPITNGANALYNPFAWNLLNRDLFSWNPVWLVVWNALFSYAPLMILIAVAITAWRKQKFSTAVSTVPLASFWFIIKSLKWGQFWYSIIGPGFLFCLSRKSLIHLLLVLHLIQCLHSTVSILVRPFGYVESEARMALIRSCMFTCDPQKIGSS